MYTEMHYSNSSFINLNQNNAYHNHTREMQVKDSVYLWAETGEYIMTNTNNARNVFHLPEKNRGMSP